MAECGHRPSLLPLDGVKVRAVNTLRLTMVLAAFGALACSQGEAPRDAEETLPNGTGTASPPAPPPITPMVPSDPPGSEETEEDSQTDGVPSGDAGMTPAPAPPPPPPSDAGGVQADAGGEPEPCGGECGDDEYCFAERATCVECLRDEHCGEEAVCVGNTCEPIIPCETSEQCEGDSPVCHSELQRCVACQVELDCAEGQICSGHQCIDPTAQCERGDDPCTSGVIPKLQGEQVIDASGDEFCDVPGFELSFSNAAWGGSDLPQRAQVRLAWSEAAIHLFADVEDPEIATNASIESLWSGDVIELYLATDEAAQLSGFFTGRIDGVQLVFTPPSDDHPPRAARLFWMPNEDGNGGWHQVREEVSQGFTARRTAAGYAIEARIAWSSFGPRAPELKSKDRIAFNLGLATASAQSLESDSREGAALLYLGEPAEGVQSCEGQQLPWCNATTWCSPELE